MRDETAMQHLVGVKKRHAVAHITNLQNGCIPYCAIFLCKYHYFTSPLSLSFGSTYNSQSCVPVQRDFIDVQNGMETAPTH